MSSITKVFRVKGSKLGKEYIIEQGGLTHSEAKARSQALHKMGIRARITPYEEQWATWIERIN